MDHIIVKGKTREEALEEALQQLGIRREEARIEVLDEGSRGFLGIGGRNVTLRVAGGGDGNISQAVSLDPESVARGLLDPLGIDYKLEAEFDGETATIRIRSRKDEGLLIGRRGQTLDALKHLVQRILTAQAGRNVLVDLEVGDYRQRREGGLIEKAEALAKQVLESGKSRSLEPMSAQDRRIVHMALAEREGLRTYTVGEGSRRRVVVALDDGSGGERQVERLEEDRPRRSRRESGSREAREPRETSEQRPAREPASAYEEIPDPSFRPTPVTEHSEKSREDSRRPRGGRRGGRGRGASRSERGGDRREARQERSRREDAPRRDEDRRREAARQEERQRQRERVGNDSGRERSRGEGPREEPRHAMSREADSATRRDAEASGSRRESAPAPRPVERPRVDESQKPFSSDLARAVLGLDEKEGEPKAPARKRRMRR